MEEAAAVRGAACEAVQDVSPAPLAVRLEEFVADGSTVPGVLALLSAQAAAGEHPDGVAEQAAGVQLIYDGLRLTRTLAHDEPWTAGGADEADMDILAADVLVSRGFYLLAHTDAAEPAVEVVRAFGRDQTRRESAADAESLDRNLEADVLALAVLTGVTSVDAPVPDDYREFARDLAARTDRGFPAPEALFGAGVTERLARLTHTPVADGR